MTGGGGSGTSTPRSAHSPASPAQKIKNQVIQPAFNQVAGNPADSQPGSR
jgi:hypothetical protein